MRNTVLNCESTLTDRYQTTIPEAIRRVLHLHKKDKIFYTVTDDGDVVISKNQSEQHDPLIVHFLNFLADDIKQHPQHIKALDTNLLKRIDALVKDAEIDLDAPLLDEDE